MKECGSCGELKSEEDFYTVTRRGGATGLRYKCKPCDNSHSNRGKRRKRYNLTDEDIADMLTAQQNRCAICRTHLLDYFAVDHDHSCCAGPMTCGGCIRGLLCNQCNIDLGAVERRGGPASPWFMSVMEYLDGHA